MVRVVPILSAVFHAFGKISHAFGKKRCSRGDSNSKTLILFVRKDATTEPLSQLTEWLSGCVLSDEQTEGQKSNEIVFVGSGGMRSFV